MAIVDRMKKMISNRGGSTRGVQTIEDAARVLAAMEADTNNPLAGLTVDVSVAADTDLLGKVIGDLQDDDVVVDNYRGKVTGTLKYVTGYTGFDGSHEELQKGNYLVLHASVPDVTGVTIKFAARTVGTLDSDGILILRMGEDVTQITFTAIKSGYYSVSRTYDITGLTLTPPST